MTVSATHRFNSFIPNGIVLVFGFTFRCDDVAWISVLRDNVVVGGYTVSLNADQTASPGGSVTFTVAPVGTLLVVKRDTQLTQTTVYNPYGRFPAKSHETALDKVTLQTQDFAELASRVAVAAIGSPPINITYPPYVANKVWAWDPAINGKVINTDGSVEAVNAAAASAAAALASQNAAAASATNAATSFDNFDDRYLGPKAAAPTLDNDGNALLVGALYWNSTNNTLNVWTGAVWTILVLDAAGLNVANIFTQPQTVQSALPQQILIETDAAADNRRWDIIADVEALRIRAVNDAGSVAADILRVERTGTAIDSVAIGGRIIANSGQITFPATQNASADANTLDDYEEGTWTPSLGGTATYVRQFGQYRKIGSLVLFTWDLQVNVIGTGSTTNVAGLPFTPDASGNTDVSTVRVASSSATAIVETKGLIFGTNTTIELRSRTAAAALESSNPIFGNNTVAGGSGHYYI